jgi:hypothetical protein
MKKRRRNATEWEALLQRYPKSGQSMADFAAAEGLDARYFERKVLRLSRRSKPSGRSAFVRVAAPVVSTPLMIQIAEVRIHCTESVSPAWIAAIAGALRT